MNRAPEPTDGTKEFGRKAAENQCKAINKNHFTWQRRERRCGILTRHESGLCHMHRKHPPVRVLEEARE